MFGNRARLEWIVILIVALVIFVPSKLPEMADLRAMDLRI